MKAAWAAGPLRPRLDPPRVGTPGGRTAAARHAYLRRLGLVELVDVLTHGEVVAALVASRLCGPAPLYDIASWPRRPRWPRLLDVPAALRNDRLGRALDAIAPVAEALRGGCCSPRSTAFPSAHPGLHLDLTAMRVSGRYDGSELV